MIFCHGDGAAGRAGTISAATVGGEASTASAGDSWPPCCGGDCAAATGPAEGATGAVGAATGLAVVFSCA